MVLSSTSLKEEVDQLGTQLVTLSNKCNDCIIRGMHEILIGADDQKKLDDLFRNHTVSYDYNSEKICSERTRIGVLAEIKQWINKPCVSTDSNIFWLYGIAGSGKSAIAHTLAQIMDTEPNTTLSYFCERGKDSKEPLKMLPT
jgi:ATP-dependent protease Clp ATPase subunit